MKDELEKTTKIAELFLLKIKGVDRDHPGFRFSHDELFEFDSIFVASACVALYSAFEAMLDDGHQLEFEKTFREYFDDMMNNKDRKVQIFKPDLKENNTLSLHTNCDNPPLNEK